MHTTELREEGERLRTLALFFMLVRHLVLSRACETGATGGSSARDRSMKEKTHGQQAARGTRDLKGSDYRASGAAADGS